MQAREQERQQYFVELQKHRSAEMEAASDQRPFCPTIHHQMAEIEPFEHDFCLIADLQCGLEYIGVARRALFESDTQGHSKTLKDGLECL